jgi:type IV pilus assembly protein PilV
MGMTDKKTFPRASQAGFTMIEVLIAVLVLSIGLLGLAGLQAASLRNNHSAYLRSQATLLAYGIADRMRANQAEVTGGTGYQMAAYNLPAAVTACNSSGCSPTNMAQNDLYEWETTLARELPNGKGVVCLDSSPDDGTPAAPACSGGGDVYAIKIWWTDSRDAAAPPQLFATAFRP